MRELQGTLLAAIWMGAAFASFFVPPAWAVWCALVMVLDLGAAWFFFETGGHR